MTKVEEKLKAGRVKRPEGSGFSEEHQKKHTGTNCHLKKDPNNFLVNINFGLYESLKHYFA